MKTIHKHIVDLFIGPKQVISLPVGAKPLTFQRQGARIVGWFEVDDAAPREDRVFEVVGTGQPVPDFGHYVATVQMDAYVWHIYEVAR